MTKKRIVSILLTLAMVFQIVGMPVFAEPIDDTYSEVIDNEYAFVNAGDNYEEAAYTDDSGLVPDAYESTFESGGTIAEDTHISDSSVSHDDDASDAHDNGATSTMEGILTKENDSVIYQTTTASNLSYLRRAIISIPVCVNARQNRNAFVTQNKHKVSGYL